MSGHSVTHFLKVNSNLTSGSREVREFRLPRMNPFPKLARPAVAAAAPVAAREPQVSPQSLKAGAGLPEMVTDLIDPATRYGAENVRRTTGGHRASGLGRWMDRILGGQRAARL